MERIELRFLSGRCHATPFDHHVNEGVPEWPPSPWRILRALLSTGFRTMDWREDQVPDPMHRLVAKLARVAPSYRLPPYPTVGHTRHYVPAGGRPHLLLDPFVVLAPGDRLEVRYPVVLSPQERTLLAALVERLPYLGRAESRVEARLLPPDAPEASGFEAAPADADRAPRGPQATHVDLLAPLSSEAFDAWRSAAREEALRLEEPASRRARAAARRVDAGYPKDLVAALALSTEAERARRWSAPPGSHRVSYDLPLGALPAPLPARDRSTSRPARPPDRARYLLLLPSPPVVATLGVAERIHRRMAIHPWADRVDVRARLLGQGADGAPLEGHRHLHLVPHRSAGRLRGLLAYLPAGWTPEAATVLSAAVRGAPAPPPGALLGPARAWRSQTPFLLVRHPRRGADGPLDQVRLELVRRGLPRPVDVRAWTSAEVRAAGFYRFSRARRSSGRGPPLPRPWGFTLRFDRPVAGPLTLGHGAHFGLGAFEAIPESDEPQN